MPEVKFEKGNKLMRLSIKKYYIFRYFYHKKFFFISGGKEGVVLVIVIFRQDGVGGDINSFCVVV